MFVFIITSFNQMAGIFNELMRGWDKKMEKELEDEEEEGKAKEEEKKEKEEEKVRKKEEGGKSFLYANFPCPLTLLS